MRPVPIPDPHVPPLARRVVVAAPDGDLTNDHIRPVEANLERTESGPQYRILIELEHEDLTRWYAHRDRQWPPRFWLICIGDQLQPFALSTEDTEVEP
jgi:hypothetical protein